VLGASVPLPLPSSLLWGQGLEKEKWQGDVRNVEPLGSITLEGPPSKNKWRFYPEVNYQGTP